MKRLLHPLLFALAALLVFEEWLWDALKAQLHRLSQLPAVAAFERLLKTLGPWSSLAVLALPGAVLFPFKFAAVWALSHGYPVVGVAVLVAAKLAGTAFAAYVFDLVRDNARQLVWFDKLYVAATSALRRVKNWLRAQPAYVLVRSRAAALQDVLRARWGRAGRMSRKFKAAKALARRSSENS